jgi:hypothetical protein
MIMMIISVFEEGVEEVDVGVEVKVEVEKDVGDAAGPVEEDDGVKESDKIETEL